MKIAPETRVLCTPTDQECDGRKNQNQMFSLIGETQIIFSQDIIQNFLTQKKGNVNLFWRRIVTVTSSMCTKGNQRTHTEDADRGKQTHTKQSSDVYWSTPTPVWDPIPSLI